jgi:hypothetical protein
MSQVLPLAISIAVLSLPALATSQDKNVKAQSEPEGFVLIEETVPVDLKQLPIDMLQNAATDFSAKNLGETAADLRAAARVFRLEAKQAQSGDHHLLNAAVDLDKLASDVRNDSLKSPDEFHARVAKAFYHAAAHHRIQAQRSWDNKRYHNAGDDLRASATAADLAAQWTGKDLAASNKASIDKARKVADQLVMGEGWSTSDVVAAFDNLEGAEGRIAGKVMPSSDKAKASESSPEI